MLEFILAMICLLLGVLLIGVPLTIFFVAAVGPYIGRYWQWVSDQGDRFH